MNDYKELIDILNDVDFADCGEHCFFPCSGSGNCIVLKAADAIEQLVKERDAAVKCIEDIETYLQWGAPQYAYKVIEEWRGVTE